MTRSTAENWDQRQFGREGLKTGDFISLLFQAEGASSKRTLSGLVHHVYHKPKAKNQLSAKFHMIREIWVWGPNSAAKHDFTRVKHIHQCIAIQCAEKLGVTFSWGNAFVACPQSACSIMGVKDVSKTVESLDIHHRSTDYAMDDKSFVVKASSDEAILKSKDLIAFSTIWSRLSVAVAIQPIVPIVGPPGTGKTRVSSELIVHFVRHSGKPFWILCTAWTNQAVSVLATVCTKYEFEAEFVLVGARHKKDDRCSLSRVTYLSSFIDDGWLPILESKKHVIVFATIGMLSRQLTDYWSVFNEIVGRFLFLISDEFTQALQANALHILRFLSDHRENQTLRVVVGDPRQLPAYALSEWNQVTCMRGILCNQTPVLLEDQYY